MSTVTLAPDPKEVTHFGFRQLRRLRLDVDSRATPTQSSSPTQQRMAVSSKFGKVFAGCSSGLLVFDVAHLERLDDVDKETKKVEANVSNVPALVNVPLPSVPTHLALSCDDLTLLVAILNSQGLPHIYLFDTRALAKAAMPFAEIAASTPPGTYIVEVAWNPVTSSTLAVVFSNGSMAMYTLSDDGKSVDCCTLPPAEIIGCVSWSPKGKQLVAGKLDGTLVQYKPDLKEAKVIPAPPGSSLRAVSILWVSTYQFLVAFVNKTDNRYGLYLVNSSKGGETSFLNYDDVCYSTGEANKPFFTLLHLAEWGVIPCTSANSIEVGVLGSVDKDHTSWVQWLMESDSRAELPLGANNEEHYPVGVALATCSQRLLPKSETASLPSPMPMLLLLSSEGLLCSFYLVNQDSGAVRVTKPPEVPSQAGVRQGSIAIPSKPTATSGLTSGLSSGSVSLGFGAPPAFGDKMAATPITPANPNPGVAAAPISSFGLPSSGSGSEKQKTAAPFVSGEQSFIASTPFKDVGKTAAPMAQAKNTERLDLSGLKEQSARKESETSSLHTDAIYKQALKEEVKLFAQELLEFKRKVSTTSIQIGSQEEKTSLRGSADSLEQFCKDLGEITISQNTEIHQLETDMLECFEWAEEAKSRAQRNKDPKYQCLLKHRGLDPSSQKKLCGIVERHAFLEQQAHEANRALDLEWKKHASIAKAEGSRFANVSTNEQLYRAILVSRGIIDSQKKAVDSLAHKLHEMKINSFAGDSRRVQTSLSVQKSPVVKQGSPALALRTKGQISVSPAALRTLHTRSAFERKVPLDKSVAMLSSKSLLETTLNQSSLAKSEGRKEPAKVIETPKASLVIPESRGSSAKTVLDFSTSSFLSSSTPVVQAQPKPAPAPAPTPSQPPPYSATKPPLFGAESSSPSLFGSAFGAAASSANSAFAAKTEPPKAAPPAFGSGAVTSTPTFGGSAAAAAPSSLPPAFSVKPPLQSPAVGAGTTAGASLTLGKAEAPSSLAKAAVSPPASTSFSFGASTTTPASGFGTSASAFSATPTPAAAAKPAVTASAAASPAATKATTPAFGSGAQSGSSSVAAFSALSPAPPAAVVPAATATSSTPTFGANSSSLQSFTSPATSTSTPIFGAKPAATSSVFGAAAASTTPSAATPKPAVTVTAFSTLSSGAAEAPGGKPATATPTSVFGSSSGSTFGSQPPTPSSSTGASSTTASTPTPAASSSLFGGSAAGASGSLFGGLSLGSSGSAVPPSATPTSPLGQKEAAISNDKGSPFSQPSSGIAAKSVFGGASASPAVGATSPFASPPSFGSAAPASPAAGSSLFGGAASSSGATGGGGGSLFGGSSSVFGGAAAPAASSSVFGGAAATTGTSLGFGTLSVSSQESAAAKDAAAKTPSNPFGKPAATAFGSPAVNQPSQAQSPFAKKEEPTQSAASPFAAASSPSAGGSVFGGQSSSGAGAFGAKPAFGSPPAFGAAPAFGSPSVFGGTPSFGSSPAFGSGSSLFGGSASSSASTAFGGGATNNAPTFGSLAQAPPTFGSVAQQSPPSTFGGFGQAAASASTGSPFGQQQASSGFGALAQQQPTFGGVSQQGSAFGGGGGAPGGSVFGGNKPAGTSFSSWR